jgi:CrcB protein
LDGLAKALWVGVGGFLGANARYWLGGWVAQRYGTEFPWGTLFINTSGSFVLGLFATLATERVGISPSARLVVAIGFIGAYTTFSTFEYETFGLVESRSWLIAMSNVLGSVFLGLLAVWLGARIARLI